MKSAVAVTYELDDAVEAARELAGTITAGLARQENSLGILFCDADMDGAAVTRELSVLLGMEVVGMTTLSEFGPAGRLESAAVLAVLSADDCFFRVAASAELLSGNHEQKIADTYEKVLSNESPCGLILAFCPCGMSFAGDSYVDVLAGMSPSTPVIGGMASDDYDYVQARVFFSGREHKNSMIAVGVSGNIQPVFALRHVTSRFAERSRRVVRAEGNVVYQVGEESFVRYIEGFGLNTDVSDPLLALTAYPMMLKTGADEAPIMRNIASLDHADGSGRFLGNVPLGSQANICLISKKNLSDSCRESVSALLDAAKERNGYEYSLIFCISCCGRATILGSDKDVEGNILRTMIPEGISLAGAYCLGELCPAKHKDGEVANRFHNCTITLCML